MAQTKRDDTSRYVLKGMSLFVLSPPLWRIVIWPLVLAVVFGLIATILLFSLAYAPQARLLIDKLPVPDWASYIIAVVIVGVEIAVVVGILMGVVNSYFEEKLFDQVLAMSNKVITVQPHPKRGNFPAKVIFFLVKFLVNLITIPLNVVPVVGNFGYCAVNGFMHGWALHMRYFEMKGFTFREQFAHVKARFYEYSLFGGMAIFCASVPLVGFFMSFSNVVGATLWALDLELQEEHAREGEALEERERGVIEMEGEGGGAVVGGEVIDEGSGKEQLVQF
eukprot:Phypoly_transcript_15210.p1 GENE.Phypoly_transcript_15210~~Phypoly_transcript_15210.p1  ORF type:complete len:279 (+),score=47.24 Phypoly_transcript_15210:48-884(+)